MMPSTSAEEAVAHALLERLLKRDITDMRGELVDRAPPHVSQDVLSGTEKHGLALLAAAAAAPPSSSSPRGNGEWRLRCRKRPALQWLEQWERRRCRRVAAKEKNVALARRFFEWRAQQQERVTAARVRFDPARGLSFHPTIREPSVGAARRSPQMLHSAGLRWQQQCAKQIEKKRERQVVEAQEEEKACHASWQMSPGTRRILRARDTEGHAASPNNAAAGVKDNSSDGKSHSVSCRRDASVCRCPTKASHRLTIDYPPFLERLQDDVRVRRERAALREKYARRESGGLRLSPQLIGDQARRLHDYTFVKRKCVEDEEPTFSPRINQGILSPPGRPPGSIVFVSSSFRQQKQKQQPQEKQKNDAELSLPKRQQPSREEESKTKSAVAHSKKQLKDFRERQRLWEARRTEHLLRLSEDVHALREEEHTKECLFHPIINSPCSTRALELQPEAFCVPLRGASLAAIEYASPTHRTLHQYEDINELRLKHRHSVKRPISQSTVFPGDGRNNIMRRSCAGYAERHARQSISPKFGRWRSAGYKAPPLVVLNRTPPAQSHVRSMGPDLDESTLLDLGIWWNGLVTEKLQVPFNVESNEDNGGSCIPNEWLLESPFTQTLPLSVVAQALHELLLLTVHESRDPSSERYRHLMSSLQSSPSDNDTKVTFGEFIELYSNMIQSKL
ncbi:hypothetical protein DQ04_06341010 [Trypanosoma grayi]|uniref:hypothetical protein n=1 Tax=Trypanosoma grayi TaxID=71804 RepID=UPI0004F46DE9|nr:hypothetical protein DQ04_06341010 [Trypanosoma grayi]KEG08836.1 hypothetical protein DQ04_06341010 [Trypanosoma grayi]